VSTDLHVRLPRFGTAGPSIRPLLPLAPPPDHRLFSERCIAWIFYNTNNQHGAFIHRPLDCRRDACKATLDLEFRVRTTYRKYYCEPNGLQDVKNLVTGLGRLFWVL
jgi:hypothetical protein